MHNNWDRTASGIGQVGVMVFRTGWSEHVNKDRTVQGLQTFLRLTSLSTIDSSSDSSLSEGVGEDVSSSRCTGLHREARGQPLISIIISITPHPTYPSALLKPRLCCTAWRTCLPSLGDQYTVRTMYIVQYIQCVESFLVNVEN